MHKIDVPFIGRPLGYAVTWIVLSIFYTLVFYSEPSMRPRFLEAVIGLAYGTIAGILVGLIWVVYLEGVTHMTPDHKWLKWATYIAYPLPPIKKHFAYRLVFALSGVIGFLALYITFINLSPLLPYSMQHLMHHGESELIPAAVGALMLYMASILLVITIMGMGWYSKLTEN